MCLKARTSFQHAIAGVATPVVIHILGTVEVNSLGTTQRKNLTLKLLFALWIIRRGKSCAVYLEKLYFLY